MPFYLWFIAIFIIFLSVLPLFLKQNRTSWQMKRAVIVTVAVLLAIWMIAILDVSLFVFCLYIGIIIVILSLSYDDPDYVQRYIDKYPELVSLIICVNGKEVMSARSEVKRPLASVVKILIAIAYTNQVVEGKLARNERVNIAELEKFYIPNTDGGAHPAWLKEMKTSGNLSNNEVTLHAITKGMIKYSSNANTEFLIDKLGADSINQVIADLALKDHDPVYPLVSALLVPSYVEKHQSELSSLQVKEKLQAMDMEEYRGITWSVHHQLKQGDSSLKDNWKIIPLNLQKIWSDRLPNATVKDYAKVMHAISNDEATLPKGASILRNIMEWPMENKVNKQQYAQLGGKGGSTAFVLNNALYAEDHQGRQVEFVLFTEGFSFMERMKMNQNLNRFMKKVIRERL
ncbi:serine hydrolase [Gracilibacillus sp. S3-1-1]|uniref:Serine hydrolase n=1 Tax=Gracilibacillus pellucidus TaxID=3095368 RepID=A0ACC6M9J5_9BACI|nr:serine hydrolase [Gracilibacillus sp. S3-1-1]MDX8047501.1 serine hydrolase [Gracilibacillus sp. S3-1-1]